MFSMYNRTAVFDRDSRRGMILVEADHRTRSRIPVGVIYFYKKHRLFKVRDVVKFLEGFPPKKGVTFGAEDNARSFIFKIPNLNKPRPFKSSESLSGQVVYKGKLETGFSLYIPLDYLEILGTRKVIERRGHLKKLVISLEAKLPNYDSVFTLNCLCAEYRSPIREKFCSQLKMLKDKSDLHNSSPEKLLKDISSFYHKYKRIDQVTDWERIYE